MKKCSQFPNIFIQFSISSNVLIVEFAYTLKMCVCIYIYRIVSPIYIKFVLENPRYKSHNKLLILNK